MAFMFPGNAQNDTGGTYNMSNICKKHIILSRNIIWLKKHTESMYQEEKSQGNELYPSR